MLLCACNPANALLVCASGNGACVALTGATKGGPGALDRVDIDSHATMLGLDAVDADTTMQVRGDEVFVLQRETGSLRIYDSTTLAKKLELPVGDAAHPSAAAAPRDFWVSDSDGIWVTLSNNAAASSLAILDRSDPTHITYLGLPQDPADPDGKPEPGALHSCNSKLYVLLASSTTTGGVTTYGAGRMAIVNPGNRVVTGVVPLAGTNPVEFANIDADCNDVVIAEAGDLTKVPDGSGNVERFNLEKASSKGVVANDVALGGRPTHVANTGTDRLFVAVTPDTTTAKVVLYRIEQRVFIGDVTGTFGGVSFVRIHDHKLYLGAGNFAASESVGNLARGLYIGPDDGSQLTTSPIDIQLTPSAIALP